MGKFSRCNLIILLIDFLTSIDNFTETVDGLFENTEEHIFHSLPKHFSFKKHIGNIFLLDYNLIHLEITVSGKNTEKEA